MSDLIATVDTYIAAYSEPDAARRSELIEKVFVADGELIDPPIDGTGHAGINDTMGAVLGQFGGHRFRRSSGVDTHHRFARYSWELVAPDGSVALAGTDVVELADDGRYRRVTGFIGELPAKEA